MNRTRIVALLAGRWACLLIAVFSGCGKKPPTPAELEERKKELGAVMRAARAEDEAALRNVLAKGADINVIAPHGGRGGRITPLGLAASDVNLELMQKLIRHGADVNICCPLAHAIRHNQVKAARLLLENGADPDRRARSGSGVSAPLMAALIEGHAEAVELLVEYGIDLSVGNPGDLIPLSYATRGGKLAVVKALIAGGADPNFRHEDGGGVLHDAAEMGETELVKYFVSELKLRDSKDNNGVTAADIAAEKGFKEIVEILAGKEE